MSVQEITVPDTGTNSAVEVIEIPVKVGDLVEKEQTILVLESEKATIEVPCPQAGKITAIHVKEGDSLVEGNRILSLEIEEEPSGEDSSGEPAEKASEAPGRESPVAEPQLPEAAGESSLVDLLTPDIGSDKAEVIEVLISTGQTIEKEQSVLVLESEKATIEVPAPFGGTVENVRVRVGDQIGEGDVIARVKTVAAPQEAPKADSVAQSGHSEKKVSEAPRQPAREPSKTASGKIEQASGARVHAGPAVRKLARKMGVDLAGIAGSGPKGRILKEDLYQRVKTLLTEPDKAPAAGSGLPPLPEVDFSKFGEVVVEPLNKIRKVSAANLHRAWVHIPHVTQFDEADITELEAFRKNMNGELKKGPKITPLAFLLKACAHTLGQFPKFNASLDASGENLVLKQYCHIGVAVDTPNGLVVPVIRNVDQKGILELAEELQDVSARARERKLSPADMQGGCFSISSLGGIGGTAFTPIVNWPEVAILGVSRSEWKPRLEDGEFVPRLMLPLSLSYDHRVIDGADAARFTVSLSQVLGDIRRLAL